MFEHFCSDIIQTMKCFALESFQAKHTKINSRLNFNPGLVLIAFWTTRPRCLTLSLPEALPWRVKWSGVRQSKIIIFLLTPLWCCLWKLYCAVIYIIITFPMRPKVNFWIFPCWLHGCFLHNCMCTFFNSQL